MTTKLQAMDWAKPQASRFEGIASKLETAWQGKPGLQEKTQEIPFFSRINCFTPVLFVSCCLSNKLKLKTAGIHLLSCYPPLALFPFAAERQRENDMISSSNTELLIKEPAALAHFHSCPWSILDTLQQNMPSISILHIYTERMYTAYNRKSNYITCTEIIHVDTTRVQLQPTMWAAFQTT